VRRADRSRRRPCHPQACQRSEIEVRQELGYNLKNWPDWAETDPAVEKLLSDHDINIRQNAAWAAQHRPALLPKLVKRLHDEVDLWVRSEVGHVLGGCPALLVLPDLLTRLAKDSDIGVQQACAGAIEAHLNALGSFPATVVKPAPKSLHDIRQKVNALTYGTYAALKSWLNASLVQYVDLDSLAEFGSVMTIEADAGKLPHAYGLDEQINTVLGVLDGPAPRAVVLVGESGTGKTALVQELVHRLRDHPERPGYVLRMTPQDFLVNTRYIGEWETRVRNIVNAVQAAAPHHHLHPEHRRAGLDGHLVEIGCQRRHRDGPVHRTR